MANKTTLTIRVMKKTLNAKNDKIASPIIIQKTRTSLVAKGIFFLGPGCWNIAIIFLENEGSILTYPTSLLE